ncbi:MAG: hypothetical protein HOP09_14270 [Hyphomicrobium sp.]|nr:hypothetical protein [Hyphomicrobium sp.]
MNRCVNDTMMRGRIDYQEGLYFKVLYANELSVSAVSHISHICKGVLFLINCHTTDIRN